MKPSLERLEPPANTSFRFFALDAPSIPFRWHYHRDHELTLIHAGSGRRFVGDRIAHYRAPDLILLGPELPHTWHAEAAPGSRQRAIVVQFSDELIARVTSFPEMRRVRALLARSRRGLAFSGGTLDRATSSLLAMEDRSPARRLLALLALLQDLAEGAAAGEADEIAGPQASSQLDADAERRIDAVRRHIATHYRSPLPQSALARLAGMSVPAFSRFFRRVTGRTFVRYLRELRIGHARDLLIRTDSPIGDICADAGFTNLSNFNRCFVALTGKTPRAFRKAFSGDG